MCEVCIEAATEITKAIVEKSGSSFMQYRQTSPEERATEIGKNIGTIYQAIYRAISEVSECSRSKECQHSE
jgi:hypothetical protein